MKVLFVLVAVTAIFAQSTIVFKNQCSGPVNVVDSSLGSLFTLSNGQSASHTYGAVSFNIKIGPQGLSLAEFAINSWDNLDFYDLSEIVGYDVPMELIAPRAGCPTVSCASPTCPQAYLKPDDNNATKSCQTGGTYTLIFCQNNAAAPTSAPATPAPAPPPSSGPPTASVTSVAGRVALYSFSANAWVTTDGNGFLTATASSVSAAAKFNVGSIANGFTLQNSASGLFASADNDGATAVVANRGAASTWETFTFTLLPNSQFWVIQAGDDGKLWAVQSNNQIIANVGWGGALPGSVLFYIVNA